MLAPVALARIQAEADMYGAWFLWLYEVQRDAATNQTCHNAYVSWEAARDAYDALSARYQQEISA